jgi:hypothetical protein
MIPAPPGYDALYRHRPETEPVPHLHVPVVAFADDGMPLVLGVRDHDRYGNNVNLEPFDAYWREFHDRLRRADHIDGYIGVYESDLAIVSMTPPNGWHVEQTTYDGSETYVFPLVGWGVRTDGSVVPLCITAYNEKVSTVQVGESGFRLRHPDQKMP